MAFRYINAWLSTLQANVLAADTTITAAPADAALLPSLAAGESWRMVLPLYDGNGEETDREIVDVTAVDGVTGNMTVARGQEGTTARDWPSGSRIDVRLTAAQLAALESAVPDHEAATDPHPQYTTEAEASAAAPVQSVDSKTGAVDLSQDYETRRQHNLTATTDPTVNDDSGAGYEPLSKWVNTSTGEVFVCLDATAGAANWQLSTLTIDDLGSAATQETSTLLARANHTGTQTLATISDAGTAAAEDSSAFEPAGLADFAQDTGTTTGLTFGYQAGSIRNDNAVTSVSAGTVTLTDATTNYVECSGAGTVSTNTTGFASGSVPLFTVVTSGGAISSVTDERAWISTQRSSIVGISAYGTFKSYQSISQSVPDATLTKITLDSEDYDTDSAFDTATSRFQPSTAGYYIISAACVINHPGGIPGKRVIVRIDKNGSAYANLFVAGISDSSSSGGGGATTVHMNGTTDYIEMFLLQGTGLSLSTSAVSFGTYMSGSFLGKG